MPATSSSTAAVWLSRGGTVVPFAGQGGMLVSFPVISNERRFDDEVAITDTYSVYGDGCIARTLAVVDSELMLDNAVVSRHSSTLMPLEPLAESVCADAAAPALAVDGGALSATWSAALGAGAPSDVLRVDTNNPLAFERWAITAVGSRMDHSVDVAALGGLLGPQFGVPGVGWAWTSSAWSVTGVGVPPSVPMVLLDTRILRDLPMGRSRFRFERVGASGSEERNHEYEEDDLTRPVIVLPWDPDAWAVKAITRTGTL